MLGAPKDNFVRARALHVGEKRGTEVRLPPRSSEHFLEGSDATSGRSLEITRMLGCRKLYSRPSLYGPPFVLD